MADPVEMGRQTTAPEIHMRGVSRLFGDFIAVNDVDFSLGPGKIHALLGENGAGKTTLLRVLCGYLPPSTGTIDIDGKTVQIDTPSIALRHGIGMVHQHSVLVPELSVAENVVMGQQESWLSMYRKRDVHKAVRRVCDEFGLELDPRTLIQDLSVDRVQQVEIVRLLFRRATTIVLDEPTAVLGRVYVDQLFATLSRLREAGRSVVIITHKIREALELADDVTVMRSGRVVAHLQRSEFDEEVLSRALMGMQDAGNFNVGSAPHSRQTQAKPRASSTPERGKARPVLATRNLRVIGDLREAAVDGLTLETFGGNVLGIAGVEGNGQRELVEALSGLRPVAEGTIELAGKPFARITPALLDRENVAVISENRLRWDLVGDLNLTENLFLSKIASRDRSVVRHGFLRTGEMDRQAAELLAAFDVRPPDGKALALTLSGGNQQKAVLAREINGSPVAVIAAHPTRGLDINATRFVHSRLADLRNRGAAILVVSADLDELLTVCDRILVMYRGTCALMTEASADNVEMIGRAMIGTHQ